MKHIWIALCAFDAYWGPRQFVWPDCLIGLFVNLDIHSSFISNLLDLEDVGGHVGNLWVSMISQ